MVEPVRHRQTKGAETDMFEPKATASHLDSTRNGVMAVPSPQVRYQEVNGPSFIAVRVPSLTQLGPKAPVNSLVGDKVLTHLGIG
jgi:hypothetical protein